MVLIRFDARFFVFEHMNMLHMLMVFLVFKLSAEYPYVCNPLLHTFWLKCAHDIYVVARNHLKRKQTI